MDDPLIPIMRHFTWDIIPAGDAPRLARSLNAMSDLGLVLVEILPAIVPVNAGGLVKADGRGQAVQVMILFAATDPDHYKEVFGREYDESRAATNHSELLKAGAAS